MVGMKEFGKIYKDKRKELNLSIEDVSDKTKIRPHILAAIEDGNFSILPSVYLKSFLKTYADFLKIPKEDIQPFMDELYKEQEEKKRAEEQARAESMERDKKDYSEIFKNKAVKTIPKANIVNYLIYAAVSLLVLALVYISIFSDGDEDTEFEQPGGESDESGDTTVIKEEKESKNLLSYFESDSLKLEARAVDTTWMQIEIDDQKMEEVLLYPGMKKTWSASEHFTVTQGNVGGIEFYRNGKKLKPFGAEGSVVKNVKITKDKVEKQADESGSRRKRSSKKYSKPEKKPRRIEPSAIPKQRLIKKRSADTSG
jgi:cytoskeletal protein RodZ